MGLNFLRALMRKLAPSILIFLGLLVFLSSSFADPFPSKKLIIFQTNDVYRIRAVDGGRRGGLARVAAPWWPKSGGVGLMSSTSTPGTSCFPPS